MVKVGFICEGETERLIIESALFNHLLVKLNLQLTRAINAEGNGNLLPHNIEKFIAILEDLGTAKIFILTDLDRDACITFTKNRIAARGNDIIIIAVKQIEAWFLADALTLSGLFKRNFEFDNPENENDPYNTLNSLFLSNTGRGLGKKDNGGKIKAAKKMLNGGFTIQNAEKNPNCFSARYFLQKLSSIA